MGYTPYQTHGVLVRTLPGPCWKMPKISKPHHVLTKFEGNLSISENGSAHPQFVVVSLFVGPEDSGLIFNTRSKWRSEIFWDIGWVKKNLSLVSWILILDCIPCSSFPSQPSDGFTMLNLISSIGHIPIIFPSLAAPLRWNIQSVLLCFWDFESDGEKLLAVSQAHAMVIIKIGCWRKRERLWRNEDIRDPWNYKCIEVIWMYTKVR